MTVTRPLPKSPKTPKTHEAFVGDLINVAGGFTFKIVPSKKLDHTHAVIPGFKQVDGQEKVKIRICPACTNMMTAENFAMAQRSAEDCPVCGDPLKDYNEKEV